MSRTISTNYAHGVTLTNAVYNPLVINSGVSVSNNAGSALQSSLSQYWSITNSGFVTTSGTVGDGIALAAGAALTNASAANVTGYAFGVSIAGAGSVVNAGRILAQQVAGNGFSYNNTIHSFTALSAGLFMGSGGVTNNSGAAIYSAFEGVVLGGSGNVANSGTISGTNTTEGLGIVLTGGGGVTNVTGGTVFGGDYAVVALGAGYFANQAGAAIISPTLGVFGVSGSQTIDNLGTITGTKVGGADFLAGGSVQNAAGATIAGGYYGVRITGAAGTVTNQGLIQGQATVPAGSSNYEQPFPFSGVLLADGGSVRNSTGATISGGSYGVEVSNAYGAVINSGLISSARIFGGAGVQVRSGGAVVNDAGGTIAAKWIGVQIGQNTASTGGTFVNYGTVFASDGTNGAAVWIHGPGEIVNNAGATIAGGPLDGVANGPYGIVAYYQTTIINSGSIGGTQFAVDAAGTSAVGNLVEMTPGAYFGNTVMGAKTNTLASLATLGLLAGGSAGTITGFGTKYENFGNISIASGAIWNVGGTIAAGTTVAFTPGGTGGLTLASPGSMSGTITGFGSGDALSLAGVTGATGVTLGSGNVLTISGTGVTLRFDPTQVFSGETFNETTSGGATNITLSGGVSASTVSAAYLGIMRIQPSTSLVSQTVSQIQSGQMTLAQFETGLIGSEQALYTTIPALVTIDAFYGATPSSATLTEVASSTSNTGFPTAIELHNLGYSDTNVWTVLASGWGADPTSSFFSTYDGDATGTTAGYTAFINAVYTREFGFAPSSANLANLLADVPGTQALLNGGGHTATPIQVMAGLYGYLLEVGQTNDIGQYASATTAFLLAAANGTVTYGPELTQEFPSTSEAGVGGVTGFGRPASPSQIVETTPGAATGSGDGGVVVIGDAGTGGGLVDEQWTPVSDDPANTVIAGLNVIAVTVPNQVIDPGTGGYTIQFLGGTSGDTLVLHAGGVDQVTGFNPSSDVLDVSALLTAANVNLNGDIAALGNYLTVIDQGSNAVLNFDPSGHGGGSAVAVLQGLGSTITGLSSLVSQGAIKVG